MGKPMPISKCTVLLLAATVVAGCVTYVKPLPPAGFGSPRSPRGESRSPYRSPFDPSRLVVSRRRSRVAAASASSTAALSSHPRHGSVMLCP